jgi:hypothetical protein
VNSQTGGVSPQPNPYAAVPGGSNAFPIPGQNEATRMIGQLLTSPRPGGPPPGVGSPLGGTPQIGAGIAGVASLSEQTGIKIYNDREKYNEWEFIYDFSKDKTMVGAAAVTPVGAPPAGATPFGTPTAPVQPSPAPSGGVGLGFQPLPGGPAFGAQPVGVGTPQPGMGNPGFPPRPGAQSGQISSPQPGAAPGGASGFGGGFGSGFGSGFGAPLPSPTPGQQPGTQPGPQPIGPPGATVRPRN